MFRTYIRRRIIFLVLILKLNLLSLNFLRHAMTELLQHYGLKLWHSYFCSLCPTGHRATNLNLTIVKSKFCLLKKLVLTVIHILALHKSFTEFPIFKVSCLSHPSFNLHRLRKPSFKILLYLRP